MHRPATRPRSSDPPYLYGSDLNVIAYLDHPAVGGIALRDDLIVEHRRSEPVIDGPTLEDGYRFEQAMGLNDLGHRHSTDATTIQAEVSPRPACTMRSAAPHPRACSPLRS